MQRAFILLWTAIAIVIIALMVLLYVSLIPHFADIGDWFIWVLRLGMICGSILMVTFTWFKIKSMHNYSKFTRHGDVVSYMGATQPHVISAIHEAAKIPMHTTVTAEPTTPDETIIALFDDGMSRRAIAKHLDIPYNRVQKLLEGK